MFRIASVLIFMWSMQAAIAAPVPPVQDMPRPLQHGQGYLVLDLRLDQRVTEISFHRPGLEKGITFGPYEKGRHLLLLPFPRGESRLGKVASPSYNLPFRQSYSRNDRMQFKILPGRINYFAQIIVGDMRSSYGFEIHVRNRLAYTYSELKEKYGPLIARYPINYAGSITDHFYEEFLKPEMGEVDE